MRSTRVLFLILCNMLACASSVAQDIAPGPDEVEAGAGPGAGHPLGDSGFYAGGYLTLSARDLEQQSASLRLDSLSLLLWWEGDSRWSAFAEAELEDAFVLRSGRSAATDRELVLERLHVDYAWSDALQLRVGKFLTPVGRWNQLHAAPLTWTTSRPLITETTFPTNATGAMLRGIITVAQRPLEWSLYTSPGEELLAEDDIDTFREAVGGRLDYSLSADFKLGVSLVDFEQNGQPGEHRSLYGVDFMYIRSGYELSGEYAVRTRTRREFRGDEHGAYLQAVLPLAGSLFGVARYETFAAAGTESDLHLYLGGVAWRWSPGRVLKLEYRHATENTQGQAEGVLASVAVLF